MTDTPELTAKDIAEAVELAKHVKKEGWHGWTSQTLASALIVLANLREQEARNRKVQNKLDANARRDNAAFWDDAVTTRDATIERFEAREKRLVELAKGWLQAGPAGFDPYTAMTQYQQLQRCAKALQKALGVEDKADD